jgi:hypothetical protein
MKGEENKDKSELCSRRQNSVVKKKGKEEKKIKEVKKQRKDLK